VNKTLKVTLIVFVSFFLLTGAFAGGFVTRHSLAGSDLFPGFKDSDTVTTPLIPPVVQPPSSSSSASPEELKELFKPFWEAWDIVHNQYVEQPVDDTLLLQGAIRGMLEALGDEQTFYMNPQTYETEISYLQGEYEGIGAYVDTEGDYLTIISPIGGSPAEAAGLRPGDKIIAIDGEDMTGYTPEEARQKVLGPAGTEVTLTIAREGESEPLIFVIKRARINIPSVTGEMLENGVAYIDINTFGDKTTRELDAVVKELLGQNPKGVIIDLRNNPGGYLTASVEVASEFIKDGVILYEQYGNGNRDVYNARGNGRMTEIPIVVLINEGSASASEIVAGALQDYGRATLVGKQSYGKGSVQNRVPLSNDMGAARVTIAKWLTPNERAIDGVGLTPDVIVEMTEEDYANERDPQLDKAVEVLLGLIAQK
jgi:carboxyl-terminal processing protease